MSFLDFLLTPFMTVVMFLIFISFILKLVGFDSCEQSGSGKKKILDEKIGVEDVKLDKGLKVERAKSNRKIVDDAVVRNIDHFDGSEELIKKFQLCENIAEKDGIFDKSLEAVYGFEDERVDKECELMTCGEKSVDECGDGNTLKEVKGDDSKGQKGSKDVGLLNEAFDGEAVEEKNGDATFGEFCSKRNEDAVASGSEGVVAGEGMKIEGIGHQNKLILMNYGGDQNDAAAVERLAADAEFLDKQLKTEAIEERREDTAIDADKDYESSTHMLSDGLEDLVVGVNVKRAVEMASNHIAVPQIEESRVESVKEDDVIGKVEELKNQNEGQEGILRDENVGDNAAADVNDDDDDDDDWEGIERTELEKVFAEAVNYVEYGGKTKDEQLVSLGSAVQMQLYGLHKLALEGPCHEPQPMALKVSARAKWNAWQNLGSMNPEVAMEEYIKILSDNDPGWMQHSTAEDYKHGSSETRVYDSSDNKSSSLQDPQANFEVGTMNNEKAD